MDLWRFRGALDTMAVWNTLFSGLYGRIRLVRNSQTQSQAFESKQPAKTA
jgi:hypothetical protein